MLELNLNLFLTFFWLFLSACILLAGIWLLLDCPIHFSVVNLILKYFYFNGKFSNNGLLSKSSYTHIYIFGLLINLILLFYNFSSFLLFILFIIHLSRRLYECIYIQKFSSKIRLIHYLFGLIYYPLIGLTIIMDSKYSYKNFDIKNYFFALIIFFNANYIQYNVHLTFAKLNRNDKNMYPIPTGYWIFNYLSCPNIIAEILIYISFLMASHRTSAMTSLVVWICLYQSLLALLNHQWYSKSYKEHYPSKRCVLIPFVI